MADAVVVNGLRRLAEAFGAIGRLRWWPGDRVRVYGQPASYVRLAHGFHVVSVDGREQLCPPESLR